MKYLKHIKLVLVTIALMCNLYSMHNKFTCKDPKNETEKEACASFKIINLLKKDIEKGICDNKIILDLEKDYFKNLNHKEIINMLHSHENKKFTKKLIKILKELEAESQNK